jgi:hypothetical protein
MTTVLRRAEPRPVNGDQQGARIAAVSSLKRPASPTKRRWGRLAAGVATGLIGAWISASLYVSAGNRTEVLVIANPLHRFDIIKRTDLHTIRISTDSEAASVNATRVDEFIGRVAGSDLIAGSLLVEGQVLPNGQKLLGADEALVGVLLGPGDGQLSLRRGSPIVVVIRSVAGDTGAPIEVKGWVFDASSEAITSRERPIELAIPRRQAALVSSAAADKRVTVVALAE